jgi:uncharacterized protein YqeY
MAQAILLHGGDLPHEILETYYRESRSRRNSVIVFHHGGRNEPAYDEEEYQGYGAT